jgi:hypothetical protein
MVEEEQGKRKPREKSSPAYKVSDRRHFTAEGDRRREFSEEDEKPGTPPSREEETVEAEQEPREGFERRPLDEPEGVDFTMLVNAMAQPALLFMGEIPHPSTGQPEVNLEQARIQVDMLDLLRVKCRGNLTAQEEGLLDRVLYELRMLYVSRTGKPG